MQDIDPEFTMGDMVLLGSSPRKELESLFVRVIPRSRPRSNMTSPSLTWLQACSLMHCHEGSAGISFRF